MAHGWNHAFGGGRLPGTARWFESIGIRPGRLHALAATVTELGAGGLLILGLLTPLAAAGVVGTMLVALVANHAKNGFFIFRPGEGYEYVLGRSIIRTYGSGSGRLGNLLRWSTLAAHAYRRLPNQLKRLYDLMVPGGGAGLRLEVRGGWSGVRPV